MLYLLFSLGPDRYALPAACVVEVLPWVAMKLLPGAPPGVAGLINYRGRPVPAIDVSENATGTPAIPRVSTRVVIVNLAGGDGTVLWLGLILEQLSQTLNCDPANFRPPPLAQPDAPYLGAVYPSPGGVIQLMAPEKLLTSAQRAALRAQECAP